MRRVVTPEYLVQRKFMIASISGNIADKYEHEARIGDGGFGVVYKVRHKEDGK